MADVEDDRYEDEETSDFTHESDEQNTSNHQNESKETSADDSNQLEAQQEPADVDTVGDSDQKFDADVPSPAAHPPGETPESSDQNVAAEEKNSVSKDGEYERFSSHTGVYSNLEKKIFVGGLSWETTDQDIKDYFSKYGNVMEVNLKMDPSTGRSRGFAFVLFDSTASVDKVFAEPNHILNDRKVDPKKALARGGRDPIKKVFVGGLPPEFPIEEIKEYFEKYGKIVEVEQPFDRVKNQRRAFIFLTYESEEIVEAVVANPKQIVGGKEVDVRKATPKAADQDGSGRGRGGFNNQRGGPNRGRGGYGGPEGWPPMPPGYPPPPGYDYYSGYYCPPYGAYPPGYDYSSYYDYSAYYSQQQQQQQPPPAPDWSSYATGAANYAPPYTGYDYSSWYGTDQSGGKMKRGTGATPYHPYGR